MQKVAIKDYLNKLEIREVKEVIIQYRDKESFQFCEDVVDIETGDVFSYIGTEGTFEAFPENQKSLDAWLSNIEVSTELFD